MRKVVVSERSTPMNTSTLIFVTAQFEGWHCWPEAPEQVSYLRQLHRHLFNVKVFVKVGTPDREVEFHMLKGWVKECIGRRLEPMTRRVSHDVVQSASCEMLAHALRAQLVAEHPQLVVTGVLVDEDGECGALVSWEVSSE